MFRKPPFWIVCTPFVVDEVVLTRRSRGCVILRFVRYRKLIRRRRSGDAFMEIIREKNATKISIKMSTTTIVDCVDVWAPFSLEESSWKTIPRYYKIKVRSSYDIEDFVETHICKLCVILRSRVLLGGICVVLRVTC